MGKAITYLNNHWDALLLYTTNPLIPIDNNEVEQLMKQVAVGRKNWMFSGSLAAGGRAADLMTLVSSAARNDLDVWAYVKGVLDQLLAGSTDYASLRPHVGAKSHPDQIRECRREERRDKADRKQFHRAVRRQAARRSSPATGSGGRLLVLLDDQVEADVTVADADGAPVVHPEPRRLGMKGKSVCCVGHRSPLVGPVHHQRAINKRRRRGGR